VRVTPVRGLCVGSLTQHYLEIPVAKKAKRRIVNMVELAGLLGLTDKALRISHQSAARSSCL
jgi:hypothetical protein